MRLKKLLKTTGIIVGSLLVVTTLGISVFVFNPLEGSLPDLRYVVPRDVDYFLRKSDLRYDFTDFPEPHFWVPMTHAPDWRLVEGGPTLQALDAGGELGRALREIHDQTELLRRQTYGYFDPLRHVIGNDLIVAGRLGGSAGGGNSWCVYARVAWQAKFAWGLLGYTALQEQLRQNGVAAHVEGDFLVLQPTGAPEPIYCARYRDCLIAGNDRDLVQRSFELASGVGDPDSLGGSATYKDGVERPLAEWERSIGELANAVEFYLRPQQLFRLPDVTFDDTWPDPKHPTDMNSRVMASFINLHGWLFLTGALIFEADSFSLLANVELNQNEHTAFQRQFFQTESQARKEWLDPFLGMVPTTACACAALRMPAGDFLREMFSALDANEQKLLDESMTATGQFRDTLDVVSRLELALLPRTGFVFRKNTPDEAIPVADPTPVPQIAWVFWMRRGNEDVIEQFVKTMTDYSQVIGFGNVFDLSLGLGGQGIGGDAAREFTNPQIPGTGEIATLIYPPFFVVSNSGPFIRDLIKTMLGYNPSIRTLEDFQEYSKELPDAINGFVYLQGSRMVELLQAYEEDVVRTSSMIDPDWARGHRPEAEADVFRQAWADRYASIPALPPEQRAQFDTEVDQELERRWQSGGRTSSTAGSKAAIREAIGWAKLFQSAYLRLDLEPRNLRLQGRAIARFQ